ncbi:hypothetical protein GGU11DRAFT_829548 [Lentinula aff. detonsa]|nr:hypothetical protein GGU11DRAFT_829548 [Lentinula aff. detonsa]
MSTRKIAILALQETHLSTERIETLNCHFGKSLTVIGSPDPENPTGKSDVAIVLNTELFRLERIKKNVIVPGRALMVQLDQGPSSINILTIYAPNVSRSDGAENVEFWRIIKDHLPSARHTKPEIMLGDCNTTEAGMIDCLPAHDDPEEACIVLDELKQRLEIRDGWRTTFPNEKRFTYLQLATGSQSRLDRIYATDKILEMAREWEIQTTGIPNLDHCIALGELVQKELEETQTHTPHRNPQRIWHQYKQKLIQKARTRAHQIISGLQRKINVIELDLSRTLNDPLIPEKQKMENAHTIQIKLAELKKTRMNKIQKEGKTKFRLEGETPTRYWSQITKEKKPCDYMYALRKPDITPNEHGVLPRNAYEKNSEKMTELARNYHNNLQMKGINPEMAAKCEETTIEVLQSIKVHLSGEQRASIAEDLGETNVMKALHLTKNQSSPGVDGLIYETYKAIKNFKNKQNRD